MYGDRARPAASALAAPNLKGPVSRSESSSAATFPCTPAPESCYLGDSRDEKSEGAQGLGAEGEDSEGVAEENEG
eukprot:2601292-Rhodomonas_salina.1